MRAPLIVRTDKPPKGDVTRPLGPRRLPSTDTTNEPEPIGTILERLMPDLLAGHDGDNLLADHPPDPAKDIYAMTPRSEGPPGTFIVHLKPAPDPDDPQGHRRLRAALKALWRRYGLRCVSASEDKGRE